MSNLSGVVIGLEIHCQLTALKSKLFCSCSSDYREKGPNTLLCPVCLGLPGSLPFLNKRAIELATMVSLALKSKISKRSTFFRKNYYYPDMPKNFQISQYDKSGGVPLALGGLVSFRYYSEEKTVEILRIQVEEDPAKLVYLGTIDTSPYTLVDYNRAGIALLEIVTKPVLRSPSEARIFLQKLRSILEHLEVSNGSLEGAMRCDANISLAGGKRVEVKNISSFKEVERALKFEITRQRNLLARGKEVAMETRHWDEVKRVTVSLRTKEEEHDYRYFPEPDLVPINISDEYIDKVKESMPELPDTRRDRFICKCGLSLYDAQVLTSDKDLSDFFEKCVTLGGNPKKVSNWMITDFIRWLREEDLEVTVARVTPQSLVEMIHLIDDGTISGKIGKSVLRAMMKTGKSANEVIDAEGLVRIASEMDIERLVARVIEENPKAVKDAFT
ncbi:Asp-tRNA(Asn)/Glu-tRNA(Gln) amidotransferase subunit GatB, partial [Candidatus Bathyarchaeota archaeon]|nr:Asp-tRNA(Asn)/Glu-tRNA(Gln) amidotransferase subunit GatB [Candidatus Bathyarchaeota archaeon]